MSEQQGPSNSKGKGVVRSSGDTSALEQNIEQSMADITAMRTSEEDYPDTKIKNVRGIISRAFPLPDASIAKKHGPPPSHVSAKGSEEFEEEAIEFRDEFLSSTKPESQSSSDHEEISYNTGDLSFLRDQVRRELESEYREALGKIKEIDRVQREDFKNALYRDVAEMVSDTMKAALVDGHIAHKGDFEYLKEENKRLMSELKKTREEMASAQQTLLNDARTDRQEYHRVLTALSDSLTELVTQISRGTLKKIEEAHAPAILETAEKLKTDTQAALHNLSQKGFHNVPPIAPIPRPVVPSSSVATVPAGRIRRKIEEKKLWE